jgi:A/G-specific adenine glycosylase
MVENTDEVGILHYSYDNALFFLLTREIQSKLMVDIEDICQICEPLTNFDGVTSYPMKPNRKKAREELDIVSVIEWQSLSRPEDRVFLLTRRPEGGKNFCQVL